MKLVMLCTQLEALSEPSKQAHNGRLVLLIKSVFACRTLSQRWLAGCVKSSDL